MYKILYVNHIFAEELPTTRMQPFQQQFVLALTHQKKIHPGRQLVEDRKAERLMMGFINPGQNLKAKRQANVGSCGWGP